MKIFNVLAAVVVMFVATGCAFPYMHAQKGTVTHFVRVYDNCGNASLEPVDKYVYDQKDRGLEAGSRPDGNLFPYNGVRPQPTTYVGGYGYGPSESWSYGNAGGGLNTVVTSGDSYGQQRSDYYNQVSPGYGGNTTVIRPVTVIGGGNSVSGGHMNSTGHSSGGGHHH